MFTVVIMKPELKLLRKMTKEPRTQVYEKNIHSWDENIVDIEGMIDDDLIKVKESINHEGKRINHYLITYKGYEALENEKNRIWTIVGVIISGVILMLTIVLFLIDKF